MDVSQYLDIFIDETDMHLQNLSDCIMGLEIDPSNVDAINEIFRAAHSLKGMAGTMGFVHMQDLTHHMEDVFQEVRSGKLTVTVDLIDLMLYCLDALGSYQEKIKSDGEEGEEENAPLLSALEKISNQYASSPIPDSEPEKTIDFLEFEFSEGELKAAKEAVEKGQLLYGFTIRIEAECLLKAARAFLVFQAVGEFGEILAYLPDLHDIEDEKFEYEFSFLFATSQSIGKAVKAVKGVSEIRDVQRTLLTYEDLSQKAKEREDQAYADAEKTGRGVGEHHSASVGKSASSRTIRVDIEKLDTLMNQASELIIAKNSLVALRNVERDSGSIRSYQEQTEYLERITTALHESIMRVRMVPVESVLNKFPRMIRDLSKKLGKKIELHMSGEDTELDRTVVDQIGDPLLHLLRNAADHGLELPEQRKEAGKKSVGQIGLRAFQEGNTVVIEIQDDGTGIDTEKIKEKALQQGLLARGEGEAFTQREILNVLFLPGFSMSEQITDVSGRGVGLDVVKSGIEALGGEVEVQSVLGKGTKFTVRLPLTLAIIQALMVRVAQETYAIALGSIQSIERISSKEIRHIEKSEVVHLREDVIALVRLNKLLGIEGTSADSDKGDVTAVIVKKGDRYGGLVVDELIGQQEIVIKSLGRYIENARYISGATILGNGDVALILDVNGLI